MTEKDQVLNVSSPSFISSLKRRESGSIEVVVHKYTGQLFRASLGLGFDEQKATELVQDTWSAFFESVPRFKGRSHIRTYIFGILYNKASEAWREKVKVEKHDSIEEVMEKRFDSSGHWSSPPMNPEEFVLAAENMEAISGCLDNLPPSQRKAFYFKEVEGYSTEQICKILGITATNLGVLLFRARNRLRECIESKFSKQ